MIDSANFANVHNPEASPAAAERDRLKQRLSEPCFTAMLEMIEPNRRARIRQGRENHVLHDAEILARRNLRTNETYRLWLKVLSNFAHFSSLSHRLIMETTPIGKQLGKLYYPCPLRGELRRRSNRSIS
jgi:hypothetical protein